MPTTRSQNSRKEVDNLSLSSDEEITNDPQEESSSPQENDKCPSCDKDNQNWYQEDGFNFALKCPCILTVCHSCAEKSYEEDEYCPLDLHDGPRDFRDKEFLPKMRIQESTFEYPNIIPPYWVGEQIEIFLNKKQIPLCFVDNINVDTVVNNIHVNNTVVNNINVNNTVVNNINVNTVVNKNINIYHDITKPRQKRKLSNSKGSKQNYQFYIAATLVTALFVLGIALLVHYWPQMITSQIDRSASIQNEVDITEQKIQSVFEQVNSLEFKYQKQPRDLWATLRLGMRNLLKKSNSPMTILLLHSENTTVDTCFLRDIKKIANDVALFQREQSEMTTGVIATRPKGVIIDMENNREVFENPGIFMEKYKPQLEQDKLMIVTNFHKSPMTVMEAFHFLTDTFDPYVKNVLIILTLEIKSRNFEKQKSQQYIAEDELRDILKPLPDHKSDPLITRLTENVYMVADDSSTSRLSCTLS